MQISKYQAKYFAHELTKRCPSNSVEKLSATLIDAQVDLNPHQIEAALFAFKSPFSKGAILADEVGLGKTIEAGIILSQQWAERKRKLIIICPSSLRKQWSQELLEKFYLPSIILEAKSYKKNKENNNNNPFNQDKIVICSYHFAKNKYEDILLQNWDLVVIDEAHKLRNVYRKNNQIAQAIGKAIKNRRKILLTATPLQNSISELYGLVSIIDEHVFGDHKSFKSQYSRLNNENDFYTLKKRIEPICKRNLRKHVQEYINYTNRIPLTFDYTPTDDEQALYDMVTDYLSRPYLYALPNSQRHLITLILRKLLASSTYAISNTLTRLVDKLQDILNNNTRQENHFIDDYDTIGEIKEVMNENLIDFKSVFSKHDTNIIENELNELKAFRDLAKEITVNQKGEQLKRALTEAFNKTKSTGANKKALIFTESKRTQFYLKKILEEIPDYKGKIILFNGQNTSSETNNIYNNWIEKHKGSDIISGAKTADTRAAIVEYFKNEATIMIATEAAAEGINLQFCSLIVNYDLPWNPQRIEQRIGRCHRYGQKHDVVVVNFVNTTNAADQRVFELLNEKFNLFSGVFGASDDVLGSIESGVDFEKRIAEIYQNARTKEQIKFSFDKLQKEMEEKIDAKMKTTRQKLFDNFDESVIEKLKITLEQSKIYLNKYEQTLWTITQLGLKDQAVFNPNNLEFILKKNPFPNNNIPTGKYRLGKNITDAHTYRLSHPLSQNIIKQYKDIILPNSELTFDYSNSGKNIAIIEPLIGKEGFLSVSNFTISSIENEDYILFAATYDSLQLDDEQCSRLLSLPATTYNESCIINDEPLQKIIKKKKKQLLKDIDIRNGEFFDQEIEKLDFWAEDKRNSLRIALKNFDDEIKVINKHAKSASSLPDKIKFRKKLSEMEKKRDEAWRTYDIEGRKVEQQKNELISNVEDQLKQTLNTNKLFTIKWKII